MPAEGDDPLAQLRERIRATQDAASRLAQEAAHEAPRADQEETVREAQALIALLQTLRDLVPAELWQQVRDLIRQLLLLVRAVIDWWVDRMDGDAPRGRAVEVEDIPVA